MSLLNKKKYPWNDACWKESYIAYAMSWWNARKQKTSTFLNGWNVGVLRRVDTRIFLQKVPTTHNQKSFSIWHKRNDLVFIALQWSIEKTQQVIWDAL